MRKHIAKAIQAGSKACRRALDRYNDGARELGDRPLLTWEEILEMGALEDFDLLRLAREDIREAAWAQPGARAAMDLHFKLVRAKEERRRLNVEIKQWVTWMKEERDFLMHHEQRLEGRGKRARALQVRKYRMLQGRFYGIHRQRLQKLSKLVGFTGSIEPGVGVCKIRRSVLQQESGSEEVEDIDEALATSAQEEENTIGDDGGAQDADDDTDDEAAADDGFEAVLSVVEDEKDNQEEEEK
jgi:hypothetical protein